MDNERSLVIGVMLLVCMGLGLSLLFGWIIVQAGGLTALYTTGPGLESIIWFLMCGGVIVYFLYLRITHQELITEKAPGPNRRMDPRELILDLDLPYRRAFDLIRRSFDSLPEGEVRSADPEKGIIEGWIPGEALCSVGPAKITITVQKTGTGKSRVTIQAITPNPTHKPIPLLIDYFHSRNDQFVKWIRDYIAEPGNQGDGTFPDLAETTPPDM
jgi:hypothetical protein